MGLLATMRADLHNTSSRQFTHHFQPSEFMPEAESIPSVEERVKQLIARGYSPAQACALATSVQSTDEKRAMIEDLKTATAERCRKQQPTAAGRRRRRGQTDGR